MDQFSLTENVDILFHSLENFTQKEGVIGKPVIQGDKTFMPVVSVTIGYGGGNASMKSGMGGGSSATGTSAMGTGMSGGIGTGTGALGLGAKLSTDAIIVIDDQSQNVSMMPISSNGQLMDKIPQIISGMTNKQSGQQGGQAGGQSGMQSGAQSGGYSGQ